MVKNKLIGFILVILAAFFWGIGGTISQKLFQAYEIPVGRLVSARSLAKKISWSRAREKLPWNGNQFRTQKNHHFPREENDDFGFVPGLYYIFLFPAIDK